MPTVNAMYYKQVEKMRSLRKALSTFRAESEGVIATSVIQHFVDLRHVSRTENPRFSFLLEEIDPHKAISPKCRDLIYHLVATRDRNDAFLFGKVTYCRDNRSITAVCRTLDDSFDEIRIHHGEDGKFNTGAVENFMEFIIERLVGTQPAVFHSIKAS